MVWLDILLIVVSTALAAAILVQSRSAGLGSAFGGGAEGFHIRRGSEKTIFRITIGLAALFLLIAIAHLFIR